MPSRVKIYMTGQFIKKTESGELDRDQSIRIVRALATAADFHKNHNILLYLRDMDAKLNFSDVIDIAAEFAQYKAIFRNKIAVLITNTGQRLKIAKQIKACMDLQGFQLKQFTDFEAAIDWLSVIR